jgi:hypothetical protein
LVYLGVCVPDEVEDVQHQRTVPSAHLVDDQIMVRVEGQFVIGDQVARDRFSVMRPEQFGRSVP